MAFWRNWSGNVSATPRTIDVPTSEDELIGLFTGSRARRERVRVAGSGHSFTALCASDDALISLDGLRGLLDARPARLEATAWAGTKLSELGALLSSKGLALENQGDVDVQSLAGAVSTGTHGTGSRFGSLSTQVVELRLILASGGVVTCSRRQEPDVFAAARVSLGLLGVISQVTLRVVPAIRLHERTWAAGVDECLGEFEALDQAHRHVEFFWVPRADKCALKTLSSTDAQPSGEAPMQLPVPGTLERYVLPERIDWSHLV